LEIFTTYVCNSSQASDLRSDNLEDADDRILPTPAFWRTRLRAIKQQPDYSNQAFSALRKAEQGKTRSFFPEKSPDSSSEVEDGDSRIVAIQLLTFV